MHATIELRAKDESKNIDRCYMIIISPNLFGEISLMIKFGRNGCKLCTIDYFFDNKKSTLSKLNEILIRRINARKRIGASYLLQKANFSDEFDKKTVENINKLKPVKKKELNTVLPVVISKQRNLFEFAEYR